MFIFTHFLIKFRGCLHFFYAEKSGGGERGSKKGYTLPQGSAKQMSDRVWERKICWKENSWETGAPFKRRTNCKQYLVLVVLPQATLKRYSKEHILL